MHVVTARNQQTKHTNEQTVEMWSIGLRCARVSREMRTRVVIGTRGTTSKTAVPASAIKLGHSLQQSIRRDWLNHAAGFFRALALVQADVLFLQGFMLVSSNLTIYRLARRKETTATAYAVLFAGLSFIATFTLLRERLVWLDEHEEVIWAEHFDMLTKPMFKKLMRCAKIRTVPDNHEAVPGPALSDYFSRKYPFKGERVLTIGGQPALSLLLEGKARVVRNLARGDHDYRVDKNGAIKFPLKPISVKPVLIERGPGFSGEISFTERQAHNGERAETIKARADVTYLPGSRYVIWETKELEEMLTDDPALRNALLACLGRTTARKLFDVTWSLGKANHHAQQLKHKLYEEFYKQEVLDMTRHTLVETVNSDAGAQCACRCPNGAEILLPRLKQLQLDRGISDDVHERALREHGFDPRAAAGASLLELCDTDVGLSSIRHTEKHTEFKRMLKANKSRNRVVTLG